MAKAVDLGRRRSAPARSSSSTSCPHGGDEDGAGRYFVVGGGEIGLPLSAPQPGATIRSDELWTADRLPETFPSLLETRQS
jgi:hypothetical protein